MSHTLALAALPLLMAALHRFRGSGVLNRWLVLALAIPAITASIWALSFPWPVALSWAIGYAVWCSFSWSRWITQIGGVTSPAYGQGRPTYWDEAMIERISFGSPHLAMVNRAALFLVPLAIALFLLGAVWWPLVIIVAVFLPAFMIAWRVHPADPFMVGELIVGASWGASMVAAGWV